MGVGSGGEWVGRCKYVCTHMLTLKHVCQCACSCVHVGGQRLMEGMCSLLFFVLFFETGSLTEPKACHFS